VPSLIDQYKQRRQAWLAQADELVRLRDEVRSAAEREAVEIVTAARRDVRRIVVEARRELLVLTAQLHAAMESVDQASLQAAAETVSGSDAKGQGASDLVSGQRALGATEDAVLDARREVRNVLDEARAEIEALAEEAHAPLREFPATLSGASHPDSSIPTLDALLGAEPLIARGATGPLPKVDVGPSPVDSKARKETDHDDGPDDNGGTSSGTWKQASDSPATKAGAGDTPRGGSLASVAVLSSAPAIRRIDEIASFILPAIQPAVQVSDAATFEAEQAEELPSEFDEPRSLHVIDQRRTFLAEAYVDNEPPTRPAWMWVGLFAATGIVAVVSTVWWFTLRDSGTALATSVTERSEPVPAAAVTPVANRATSSPAASSGLEIEARRSAWIRVIVDGKEDSRVYQAGETRQISGAKSVSIRAGDGGAVFVSMGGRPAQPLGSGGVAVTRQYSLISGSAAPVPAVATPSPAPSIEPLAVTPATSNVAAPNRRESQAPLPPIRPEVPRVAPGGASVAVPPSSVAPAVPASSAAPSASEAAAAAPSSGGRADLIAAGQQWLDAYQRRDRDGMSSSGTENMTISDERTVTERFPAWQAGVRRDLDQLELELSGDTALLTARMTERSGEASTTSAQHVSRVSQIWIRRGGRWRLADVRIIGEARLNQIVR
jgi:ketosteroid isomerase-like protein